MAATLDCHQHVGDLRQVAGTSRSSRRDGAAGVSTPQDDLDTRLATMDAAGISQAVVLPSHGYFRASGLDDTRRINEDLASYRSIAPDRLVAAVGIMEPLYGPAAVNEIPALKSELGFCGVSFHVRFQGCTTDSPLVHQIVDRMGAESLVPFVHAYAEASDEALWRLDRLVQDFPELDFVVLDAFSSYDQFHQCLQLAERRPNVVFDTALTVAGNARFVRQFVRRVGAERVVFGSNLYSSSVVQDLPFLDQLRNCGLTPADEEGIFGGTIRRILRMVP